MASSVRLQFHGPEDAVHVPGMAEPVKRGATLTVSPEMAGEATDGEDIGDGLLAQTYTDPATGQQVPSFTVAVEATRTGKEA
jgi:hypothetical protein